MELMHYGVPGMKWGVRHNKRNIDDIISINKSLSKKEKMLLSGGDSSALTTDKSKNPYKNNKRLLYSKSMRIKNVPVSYLNIWDYGRNLAGVSIATRSDAQYRGKGYASQLVKSGKEWFDKQDNLKKLYWDVDSENIPSQKLAEKNGFKKTDFEYNENNRHFLTYVYKGKEFMDEVFK